MIKNQNNPKKPLQLIYLDYINKEKKEELYTKNNISDFYILPMESSRRIVIKFFRPITKLAFQNAPK